MENRTLLPLVDPALACSLEHNALDVRLDQWRTALAGVRAVAYSDDTRTAATLDLPPDAPLDALARLCVAEVACCPFFTFSIGVAAGAAWLHVAVPTGAHELLAGLIRLLPTGTPLPP